MSELPKGWAWTTLVSIAQIKGGLAKGQKRKPDESVRSVPYLRVANVQRGYLDLAEIKYIEATDGEIAELRLQAGDVLFNEGGDRDKLGRGWIWNGEIPECIHQNHVFRARPLNIKINPKFLSYYSNSFGQKYFLDHGKQTTNLASINITKLGGLPIPLAPALEQLRLVAEIENQFSRLDAAVASLNRVKANLKRYRASVLKDACEGRLVPTEAELAEKEHRTYEPAAQLLKRILNEKTRSDPDKQEITYVDHNRLPTLPTGWCWAEPEQITAPTEYSLGIGPFGSNLKVSDYAEAGIPLIFVRNIRSEDFSNTSTRFVSKEKATELRPHWVFPGDLLITKMGEPPGDACVYSGACPTAVITADCIRWRVNGVNVKFVLYAIRSLVIKRQIIDLTRGVAQKKISLERFKSISVPVPPLAEQQRIVEEVDRRLSVIDEVEAEVAQDLARAARLRQSILQLAFTGKLVPQDPSDEPAEQLLARIQQQCTGNQPAAAPPNVTAQTPDEPRKAPALVKPKQPRSAAQAVQLTLLPVQKKKQRPASR